MNQNNQINVSYVHLEIKTNDGFINGFAICYDSLQEAITGFKRFHDYLDTPGNIQRNISVRFTKETEGKYRLVIQIVFDENFYTTEIHQIDETHVSKLRNSLDNFQFFFITSGYLSDDGSVNLLPIKEFNFFKNDIEVDGVKILGKRNKKWPMDLFE